MNDVSGETRTSAFAFAVTSALVVALAAALRFLQLGTHELWMDEAFSYRMATTEQWPTPLFLEHNPPLYYALLRSWVLAFGPAEVGLRSLSAILGTAFVVAVIWAGRSILSARVGLWSGAFAAVSPIHIYYSQEARAYALLTLTLVITHVALWRALRRNTWPSWLLVSLCAAAALYSHYFAFLGLLPTVLLVAVRPAGPGGRLWHRYVGSLSLAVLLFLPWVLRSFLMTHHDLAGVSWIPEPSLLAVLKSLEIFALGSQPGLHTVPLKQFHDLDFPPLLRLIGLAAFVALGLLVATPRFEDALGIPSLGRKKRWLAAQLLLPLVVLWLVSLYRPLYVVGRYEIIGFSAFALLVGLGLAKMQAELISGRMLAPLLGLTLLCPLGVKLVLYYAATADRPAERIARTLDAVAAPGDTVIMSDFKALPVAYYLERLGYRWRGDYPAFQPHEGYFGSCRVGSRSRELDCRAFDPRHVQRVLPILLREPAAPHATLWVVHGYFVGSRGAFRLPGMDLYVIRALTQGGYTHTRASSLPGLLGLAPSASGE